MKIYVLLHKLCTQHLRFSKIVVWFHCPINIKKKKLIYIVLEHQNERNSSFFITEQERKICIVSSLHWKGKFLFDIDVLANESLVYHSMAYRRHKRLESFPASCLYYININYGTLLGILRQNRRKEIQDK